MTNPINNALGDMRQMPMTPFAVGMPGVPGPQTYKTRQTFAGPVGNTPGALLDMGEIVFDVKAYGAKGDGVTSDTAAILAAMTAAGTGNGAGVGGVVWFPPGNYIVTGSDPFVSVKTAPRRLLGPGTTDINGSATITSKASSVFIQSTSSFCAQGLVFKYSSGTTTCMELVANNFSIQNCAFIGAWQTCILNDATTGNVGKSFVERCEFWQTAPQNGGAVLDLGRGFWSIKDNLFFQLAPAAGAACIIVNNASVAATNGTVVSGNVMTSAITNGIVISKTTSDYNVVYGNIFTGVVTNPIVNSSTANNNKIFANPGYNPVGKFTSQPAVPSSTVAQTNNFGVDATVYVNGGTVTDVAIGGNSTGDTLGGAYRVAAGQSITLTYSVAPTWVWMGD